VAEVAARRTTTSGAIGVTEQRRRRPGAGPVIWGSVALFAVLFALLTHQLSAGQAPAPRPVLERKVIKRRVVTTVVPTPGRSQVTSSGTVTGSPPPESAPVTTGAS
jgi:hypothetical protein